MERRTEEIKLLARVYGWREIRTDPVELMVSFSRKGVRLNVWWTRMTVGTALMHPKIGTTQLFRRNVSMETLEKIFENPRVHTGKGYYRKGYYGRGY